MDFLSIALGIILQVCSINPTLICQGAYFESKNRLVVSVCQVGARTLLQKRVYRKDGKTVIITINKECVQA